jgi:lactate permease
MPWREAGKKLSVDAASSIAPGSKVSSAFTWAPFSGGTAILASWIIVALLLRLNAIQFREVIKKTWHQVLGCLPGWSLYLWPCVRVQFFRHGWIACVRVLQDRILVHHCGAHPWLSVGAEVGKPVAPQTASFGVSTSRFVRNEGAVIRHNMAWTLILLIYLILIGVLFYLFFPRVMALD